MSDKIRIPKLSIITPSFNQGKFIEQTIKSVVSQNYPNIEYLIMDGGSTDNSVNIIRKYAKKYPYIKWVSKKDDGQVDAINKGLGKSNGDIVAYINSDDYYLTNSFNEVVNYFAKNPQKNWVVGDCKVTQKSLGWTFFLKSIAPFGRFKFGLELYNPVNQPAVFLTKKIVKKVGKFNNKYKLAFDYEYWLRCSQISLPGRLRTPLAVFRVHQQSKGGTSYKKQFEEEYEIIKKNSKNIAIIALHFLSKQLTFAFYSFLK